MARKELLPLRWIQSNIKYTRPVEDFWHALNRLHHLDPQVITLNEVGGRVDVLRTWAASMGYIVIQPQRQNGMEDDQAILLDAAYFHVNRWGIEQAHKEPPGHPSARYLLWADVMLTPARLPMLLESYHSLAAVERKGRFNHIARLAYYVAGNRKVVSATIKRRREVAKRSHMPTVPVVLAGDLNWSWTASSWINKTMGLYFQCCHTVLPRVPTLGKRSVDIVAKRGGRVKFVRQFAVTVPSDHRALVVDLEIWAR